MAEVDICLPGHRLCREDVTHVAGKGTYIRDGFIYSSLLGWLEIEEQNMDGVSAKKYNVCISEKGDDIPSIGAVVMARVTNVNPRFCKCDIISIGTSPLCDVFRGLIRKEDVRATEKDKVEMYKCYRPGDIIVAKVLSLGDAQSYLLTTAENELGVAMAVSEQGAVMVPVSWNKMQCPRSLCEEYRKVAKAQQKYITFAHSFNAV